MKRALLSLAYVIFLATSGRAATLTVTTTNESGPGSLQNAVLSAANGDTIVFSNTNAGGATNFYDGAVHNIIYTQRPSYDGDPRYPMTGALECYRNISIVGPGYSIGSAGQRIYKLNLMRSSASGTPLFRIFSFISFNQTPNVTISGLAISNGAAGDSGFPGNSGGGIRIQNGSLALTSVGLFNNGAAGGGGIFNYGAAVTMSDCELGGNYAAATDGMASGGGISNYQRAGGGASLTITNSVIGNNGAQMHGGGIATEGDDGAIVTVNLTNSTIASNSATNGGGLYSVGTSSTVTINSSTFYDNYASNAGGGIGNIFSNVRVKNSTIGKNRVTGTNGGGGGIYSGNAGNPGASSLSVTNTTFTDNSATHGGCIFNDTFGGTSATTTVGNTIFNTGTGSGPTLKNNGGSLTSQGYNLSSDDGGGLLTNGTDLLNTNPLLDSFAAGTGPTPMYALLVGSPAIDRGKDLSGTGKDQRGQNRPYNYNGIVDAAGGDGSDIGAYEVQGPTNQQNGSNLTVTTTSDVGDGSCTPTNCSLREAIGAANSYNLANGNSGATISFSNSTANGAVNFYNGPHIIILDSALPALSTRIALGGPGSSLLGVHRNSASGTPDFRIFKISSGTNSGPTVSISGLTLRNGKDSFGGGIYSDHAVLALNDCAVIQNEGGGGGGGVFNRGLAGANVASLTITNCSFSSNSAATGGAVYNDGLDDDGNASASISNTVFNANVGRFTGGAITNATLSSNSAVTVDSCTLSGNTSGSGGGLYNYQGTFTLTNSTLSGNSVTQGGGAICNAGEGTTYRPSTLNVRNCTISGNYAQSGGGISNDLASGNDGAAAASILNTTFSGNTGSGGGGAVHNQGSGAQFSLGSCVLNKATAAGANIFNNGGGISSQGYNLSSDNSVAYLTAATDQNSIDPKLGPLQSNGGSTLTHALLAGSPAIDKGKNFFGPQRDQRSAYRPHDFGSVPNAVGGDATDVGSFEATDEMQIGANLVVNTLGDTNDELCGTTDCTLREAIRSANVYFGGPVTITFNLPGAGARTIDLSSIGDTDSGPSAFLINHDMTIQGPAANQLTVRRVSGGDYRLFRVASGRTVTISGLTISNGNRPSDSGGGVLNDGTLTLQACALTGNYADNGGAIRTNGMLTLDRCTLSGNSAYQGAGVFSQTNLTGLTTVIRNSTLSGNIAANNGGGLDNAIGLTQISNSTITRNTAPEGNGSGVFSLFASNTRTEIYDSIIANNVSTDVDQVPGSSSYLSKGYNIIGYGGGAGAFTGAGDTKFVTNPKLAALAYNGGGTNTHALLLGSPAINAGAAASSSTDQRGLLRQYGSAVDIGAYELQPESYIFWASYSFPPDASASQTAATADYDGDGIVNGLEQLMGKSPTSRDKPSSLLQFEIEGNYLVLQFERSIIVDPTKVSAEQSINLQQWNTTGISFDNLGPATTTTEFIQALIPIDGAPKKFGRLRYSP